MKPLGSSEPGSSAKYLLWPLVGAWSEDSRSGAQYVSARIILIFQTVQNAPFSFNRLRFFFTPERTHTV